MLGDLMKNTQKILLSFAFVLGTAFITHYFFVQRIESQDSNRDVASFGERNSSPQIKWEQKVAEELSDSTTTQASVKPNWQDLLVYEYLSGQYDVVMRQGQIEKMQLQPSMNGVQFQTKDFIEKYGHQIKKFATYKIQTTNDVDQVQLFDQSGAAAGTVQIDRTDKGLVRNISFQ
jgi:hypothetical protein